ncbi:hypothetical protein [Marinactinospora rubrisoli]|uniref:Uncharacterized protein n=1 Tax=Marinactinospora rubrisoli TaxID=2715399 RepID=A0ABW2KPG7_9ACTN
MSWPPRPSRRRPGRPHLLTNADPVRVATAQIPPRRDTEHHRPRVAPSRIGHPSPRPPCRSEDNRHLPAPAPVLFAVALWPTRTTPTYQETLVD